MISIFTALWQEPLIAVFLVATLVVAIWAGRDTSTLRDYAVANRSMGTGVLALTLIATLHDGQNFFMLPNSFYIGGLATTLSLGIASILFPLLLGLFLAPKMVFFSDCYTLPAIMGKLLGTPARIFTATITSLAGIAIVVLQFKIIGDLFSKLLDVQPEHAILVIGLLMTGYIFWSGIRAVSITDVLQFLVMVVGLSYVVYALTLRAGGITAVLKAAPDQWQAKGLSTWFIVRLCYLIFFSSIIVIYPGIMQRMLMARDKRQGRYMFFSFALFSTLFFAVLLPLICLSVYKITSIAKPEALEGGSVMHFVLHKFSEGPMKSIVMVGLLAAIMSTVDSYTSAIGLTLVYDILVPLVTYSSGTKLKDHKVVTLIRISTLLVGCTATLLACYGFHLQELKSIFIYLCGMIFVGCILPILGLKTTYYEFVASALAYASTLIIGILWVTGGEIDYTIIRGHNLDALASFLSLLTFLVVHVLTHRGIMTVTRSHQSVSEQLWLPEHSEMLASLQTWYKALYNLEATAYLRYRRYGSSPYVLGFFLAMQYMIPQLHIAEAAKAITSHMLLLKSCGALLLAGLWLEGAWPIDKRHRFPLYYYLTIGYCLPFLTTFLSLCDAGSSWALVQWCVMILLLVLLTDYVMMMHLLPTGTLLALLLFRALQGYWIPTMPIEGAYTAGYLALFIPLILFAFGRIKEDRMFAQVRVAKALGSGIAHETRNFLTGSMGTGSNVDQFLEMHPAKEVQPKEAKRPLYQVNQLVYRNIDALLENLREAGPQTEKKVTLFNDALRHERFDIHMGEHSLKACVAQALQDFFLSSAAAARRLETHLDDDFIAHCSAPFFGHLIYNLVRNAMHHGHAEKIRITTHAATRTLTIQDNGKGIPPARIPRIFDLFYTSDKSEYTNRTGLGLALVKEIVDSWKATIHVQSQQGEGSYTRFEITFPPRK